MLLDAHLRTQVALSCRILAMHGHTDLTLGHVSARDKENVVYIKRKDIGLDEVTPEDVLPVDLDGNLLGGEGDLHLETRLHTEVYKVRDDVNAIAHTHPPFSTALGATGAALEMFNHDAVLFYDGLGNFDQTAGLITSSELGQMVARSLGSHRAVLMRNHGVLVVGRNIPWLTYTALTLERAIKFQIIATSLGQLTPLKTDVAEKLCAEKHRNRFIESYWGYLIRKVEAAGCAFNIPGDELSQ
ncbi:MAG: class II aldolase [Ardenticatenaceae bacterium]|nr:MAG: class II aldolase [Ardenticatenaceae bacterium]